MNLTLKDSVGLQVTQLVYPDPTGILVHLKNFHGVARAPRSP